MVHCQENFVYVNLCTIRQWCRNIGLSKFPFHYKWVRWYYYDNVTDDDDNVDDYREYNNEIEIDADNCHGRKRAGDVQQHLPKTTGKMHFSSSISRFLWHCIRAYKTTSFQNYRLSDFVYVHQKMSNTSQDETFLKSTSCLNWKQNLCFSAKYLWGWSYLPSENSQSGFP